ncbi:MAG TPA: 5-methyltetrahydropteroyltriglutamate--homocysteine S-methyltransferase [Gryllotalpicola sp.]
MELAQLRALRELRDRGSIAAVAVAFRVTPSAVSQQLAGLQRSVGVPLTRLEGRRTVLTDAGTALADAAVAVESALIDAANSITEFHDDAAAPVSVSAFSSAALALFPGLLAAQIPGRPHLVLQDEDVTQSDFARLAPDIDLVIAQRLVGSADWPEQLAVTPLLTEPLDVAFRVGHRLDTLGPVTATELRNLAWIGTHDDFPLGDAIRTIGAAGGAEPIVAHRVNDFAVAAAMIAASDHLALLPRHTSAAYRSPAIRLRPLAEGIAVARRVDVLARPDTMHRRGVRAVLDTLRALSSELVTAPRRTAPTGLVPAPEPATAPGPGTGPLAPPGPLAGQVPRTTTSYRGGVTVSPPFRADIVGSFLRPTAVKQARAQHEMGALDAAALRAVEDEAIGELIAKEADAGLRLATDGEFRRAWWHYDFFGMLDGVQVVDADHGIQFTGINTKNQVLRVDGKVAFPADHPMLRHFAYLRDHVPAGVMPKMSIPSPTVMHFRLDPDAVTTGLYAEHEDMFDDLAAAYRDAVRAFYDAGCRYLQFDDTAWAYLCSQAELDKAAARGIRVDGLAERYAKLINDSLAGKPDDLVVTTHVCRGNFRSTWIASGGYEPVAEPLLAGTDYDGYFLEYDTERAGDFEPLRHLPRGDKTVVLGLLTSKDGALEDPGLVKARIDEAARFAPLDQLALSTQCGFASTEDGNVLTEQQQWAKVREVVAIAADVWR